MPFPSCQLPPKIIYTGSYFLTFDHSDFKPQANSCSQSILPRALITQHMSPSSPCHKYLLYTHWREKNKKHLQLLKIATDDAVVKRIRTWSPWGQFCYPPTSLLCSWPIIVALYKNIYWSCWCHTGGALNQSGPPIVPCKVYRSFINLWNYDSHQLYWI